MHVFEDSIAVHTIRRYIFYDIVKVRHYLKTEFWKWNEEMGSWEV